MAGTDAQIEDDTFTWGRLVGLFAPHRARLAGVVAVVLVSAGMGIIRG